MKNDFNAITEFLLDRSPTEWIGALFVALLLSLVLAGVYTACRRKMKDAALLLVILALFANLAGIIAGAGYVSLSDRRPTAPPELAETVSPDALANSLIDGMASRILMGADADHNGLLSADEAAAAAEQFVKRIDTEEQKPVDMRVLGGALKRRIKPPAMTGRFPGVQPPGPGTAAADVVH